MKYKLTYCEELTVRLPGHKPSFRIIARLVERNKQVNQPRKVRNPKVAEQVNAMYAKWLESRAA